MEPTEPRPDPIFLSFGLAFFTPSTPKELVLEFTSHGGQYYPWSSLRPGDLALCKQWISPRPAVVSKSRSRSGSGSGSGSGSRDGSSRHRHRHERTVMDIDYYFVSGGDDPMLPLLQIRPFVLFRAGWVLDSLAAGRLLGLEGYIVDQPFLPQLRDPNIPSLIVTDATPPQISGRNQVGNGDNVLDRLEQLTDRTNGTDDTDRDNTVHPTPNTATANGNGNGYGRRDTTSTLPTIFVDPSAFTSQRSLVETALAHSSSTSTSKKQKLKSKQRSKSDSRASDPHESASNPRLALSAKRPRAVESKIRERCSRIIDLTRSDDEPTSHQSIPQETKQPKKVYLPPSPSRFPFPSPDPSHRGPSTIRTIAPPGLPGPSGSSAPLRLGVNHQPRPTDIVRSRSGSHPESSNTKDKSTTPDLPPPLRLRFPRGQDRIRSPIKRESEPVSTPSYAPPRDGSSISRFSHISRTKVFRESLRDKKVFDFEDVYEGMSDSQTPLHQFGGLELATRR